MRHALAFRHSFWKHRKYTGEYPRHRGRNSQHKTHVQLQGSGMNLQTELKHPVNTCKHHKT